MGDEMEVGAIRMAKFIVPEHEYPELYAALKSTPGRARNGVMRRLAALGLQVLNEREAAEKAASGVASRTAEAAGEPGPAAVVLESAPVIKAAPRPAPEASAVQSPAPGPSAAGTPNVALPGAAPAPVAPAGQARAGQARGVDRLSDEFLLG